MIKPKLDDFPEYYRRYIAEVIDTDILYYFEKQKLSAINFFHDISEEKSLYRYEENKWSIKEILGHICDAERIFITRALQFARGENKQLPGFDENEYVANSNFDDLPLYQLLNDFKIMRESHISLFNTFDDKIWNKRGTANDTEYSIASIVYIVAGHLDHHVKVIKERYLKN